MIMINSNPDLPRQLIDSHGREISYVRLSVTDRCNLRCFYCMPEEGIAFLKRKELLTYEEMLRLIGILSNMGINKVRITGGEPFVRKDLIHFLEKITHISGINKLNITTNGILTGQHIPKLKSLGIDSVNLSLDTLDQKRFFEITRRDEFKKVMDTFYQLIDAGIRTKINMVVIDGKNDDDILPMAELAEKYPVEVRFIEEMPFNGKGQRFGKLKWNHHTILETLREKYDDLTREIDVAGNTSTNYKSDQLKGNLGIIAAYSRTFCGQCNRIRITSQGFLQTCLYEMGQINLKSIMRQGVEDDELARIIINAVQKRAKDGFEAEARRGSNKIQESMSVIGG